MHEYYVSTYCNFPHRLQDGKPVQHECRVIPPEALRLEREGKFLEAIEEMNRTPVRMMRKGVRS